VRWRTIVAASGGLLLTACGGVDGGESGQVDSREITVAAAASLTAAFTDIAAAFQGANPGAVVLLNFGPSDGLAGQIDEGAPVDVFASASPEWMDSVQDEGPGVSGRADFARNRLAIIVPADNPAGIEGLDDLAEDGVKLVIAAEGVPAGDYARQLLDQSGTTDAALANVVSNEEDVKGVITKVLSGDADAGIGYVTDVTPDIADRIALVEIPDDVNVIASYPIAVVTGTEEADLAQLFVDYVLGDGQRTLADYGFLPPA
jgi:molybdate transport system substrate-binding protein